jgi:hypothetical protein
MAIVALIASTLIADLPPIQMNEAVAAAPFDELSGVLQ